MTDLITRLREEAGLCRNEGADDIAALLEEAAGALEASGKDAARLEWFISNAVRLASPHMNGQHEYHPTMEFHKLRGPSFRAAIDAAMEKANG